MKNYFFNKRYWQGDFKNFFILFLFTVFCFLLIAIRMYLVDFGKISNSTVSSPYRGTLTFLFLIWNLFLAWIPYWISLYIEPLYRKTKSVVLTGFVLCLWLLFLPNAPYILTDLFHLEFRPPVPYWFDLMTLVTFAWTGLMLGLYSLKKVHDFCAQHFSMSFTYLVIIVVALLNGLGVYIGRFLRWNSWDIATRPYELLLDLKGIILTPSAFPSSGSIPVMALFFLLAYLSVFGIAWGQRDDSKL